MTSENCLRSVLATSVVPSFDWMLTACFSDYDLTKKQHSVGRLPLLCDFFPWSRPKGLRKLIKPQQKMYKTKFHSELMVAPIHKGTVKHRLVILSRKPILEVEGQTKETKEVSDIPTGSLWINPFLWEVIQVWLLSQNSEHLLKGRSISSRIQNPSWFTNI